MRKKLQTLVFDNNGQTIDRYTILLPDGDICGASGNPFHPQGFGQFCGSVVEYIYTNNSSFFWSKRVGWWKKEYVIKAYKAWVKMWSERKDEKLITDHTTLPTPVQEYIKQLESELAIGY